MNRQNITILKACATINTWQNEDCGGVKGIVFLNISSTERIKQLIEAEKATNIMKICQRMGAINWTCKYLKKPSSKKKEDDKQIVVKQCKILKQK